MYWTKPPLRNKHKDGHRRCAWKTHMNSQEFFKPECSERIAMRSAARQGETILKWYPGPKFLQMKASRRSISARRNFRSYLLGESISIDRHPPKTECRKAFLALFKLFQAHYANDPNARFREFAYAAEIEIKLRPTLGNIPSHRNDRGNETAYERSETSHAALRSAAASENERGRAAAYDIRDSASVAELTCLHT